MMTTPTEDTRSAYLLELSVEPGGARRGERFVYRAIEHIFACLAWEFLAGSPERRRAAATLAVGYGETIRLWIIERGVVTRALDLEMFLRVSVDGGAPLTLGRARRAAEGKEVADFVFQIDFDGIRAATPPLAEPTLRPGETMRVRAGSTLGSAARDLSALLDGDDDAITYGYHDIEGGELAPDDLVDPDPPADDEAQLRQVPSRAWLVARADRALAAGDIATAKRVLEMFTGGAASAPGVLRARIALADGHAGQALVDALRAGPDAGALVDEAARRCRDEGREDEALEAVERLFHETGAARDVKVIAPQLRALGIAAGARLDVLEALTLGLGAQAAARLARVAKTSDGAWAMAAGWAAGVMRAGSDDETWAVETWQASLARAPESTWIGLSLGLSLGRKRGGVEVLQRTVRLLGEKPRSPVDEVCARLRRIWTALPARGSLLRDAAEVLAKAGEGEAQAAMLRAARDEAEHASDRWKASRDLALLATDQRWHEVAAEAYEHAIATWSDDLGWSKEMVEVCRYNGARELAMIGRREEALRELEAAVRRAPQYAEKAREEPCFAALGNDASFVALVGGVSVAKEMAFRPERGHRVRHAKLGLGVVESVEGRGEQAKVEVLFEDGSRRKLLAKVLSPVA